MPTYNIIDKGLRQYQVSSSDASAIDLTVLNMVSGITVETGTYNSPHVVIFSDTDAWYQFNIVDNLGNISYWYIIEDTDGKKCLKELTDKLFCKSPNCKFQPKDYYENRVRVSQIMEYIRVLNNMCYNNFLLHSEFPWMIYTTQQKIDVYNKYLELVKNCNCHDHKKHHYR